MGILIHREFASRLLLEEGCTQLFLVPSVVAFAVGVCFLQHPVSLAHYRVAMVSRFPIGKPSMDEVQVHSHGISCTAPALSRLDLFPIVGAAFQRLQMCKTAGVVKIGV